MLGSIVSSHVSSDIEDIIKKIPSDTIHEGDLVIEDNGIFNKDFAYDYDPSDIKGIFNKQNFNIKFLDGDLELLQKVFTKSNDIHFNCSKDYDKFIVAECRHRFKKTSLYGAYHILLKEKKIVRNKNLERFMKFKATRGNSGIVSITTFMKGSLLGQSEKSAKTDDRLKSVKIKSGGCPEDCAYCPDEKINGVRIQPRSYLSEEPGNARAAQNKHHPVGQVFDRANTLEKMGHISCFPNDSTKIEFIISGGTFNFFPEDYIVWYVTCTYYALNVYYDYKLTQEFGELHKLRDMLSLEEEQLINETASLRMIGLTIETRPDRLVDPNDKYKIVRFFRRLGVTRVQIGVQTTDDDTLRFVNRNCTNAQNMEGIRVLLENGFKCDIHLMLDLPKDPSKSVNIDEKQKKKFMKLISTLQDEIDEPIPEYHLNSLLGDLKMIDEVILNENLQADQWKVYPTIVTQFTKIHDWYYNGTYKPYAEFADGKLLELCIIYLKSIIPEYIRINRIIRDMPVEVIHGGISCPNMRDNISKKMKELGLVCKCERCREVKDKVCTNYKLFTTKYESSGGTEYYISFENENRTELYGKIRLRLNKSNDTKYMMPELEGCALIRELHVYGQMVSIGTDTDSDLTKTKTKPHTQHKGFGKKLLKEAEKIAYLNGFEKIIVISGVGVKEYYRKQEFVDYHTYMIKYVYPPEEYQTFSVVLLLIFCTIYFMCLLCNYY